MNDKLFRTSIVGGYNKEDVLSYISRLETELMRAQKKLSAQEDVWESPKIKRTESRRESTERRTNARDNIRENIDEDVIILKDTQDEDEEREYTASGGQQETKREVGAEDSLYEEQSKELAETKQELEKVRKELLDAKTELGISNQKYEQSEQKKDSLLEVIERLVENYNGLQVSQCYLVEQIRNFEHIGRQIETIQRNVEYIAKVDVDMTDSF